MSDTNFNLFKIFCVVVETENYMLQNLQLVLI